MKITVVVCLLFFTACVHAAEITITVDDAKVGEYMAFCNGPVREAINAKREMYNETTPEPFTPLEPLETITPRKCLKELFLEPFREWRKEQAREVRKAAYLQELRDDLAAIDNAIEENE